MMKIPENDPSVLLERAHLGSSGAVNREKGSEASKGSETAQPSSKDQVNISEKARTLQQVNQSVETDTDIRSERVEKIRNEIAAGIYQPDARHIAEKLVRSTLLDNLS